MYTTHTAVRYDLLYSLYYSTCFYCLNLRLKKIFFHNKLFFIFNIFTFNCKWNFIAKYCAAKVLVKNKYTVICNVFIFCELKYYLRVPKPVVHGYPKNSREILIRPWKHLLIQRSLYNQKANTELKGTVARDFLTLFFFLSNNFS
jgi:hypothetical protein